MTLQVPRRSPDGTVAEALATHVDQFDPFEAMRLLASFGKEPVVSGALTNRFVPTALRSTAETGEVEAAFVGLVGPLGPLPPFYTETALREKKHRSHAMRAFFDIFVDRFAGFFVRTFEKYRLPPSIARHGAAGGAAATDALYAMIGLGLPTLRGRMGTSDARLLPYAGLLVGEVRSAAGLEVILRDLLGLNVGILSMSRRWLPIEAGEQTSLAAGGHFSQLGIDAVAGARTLDVSSTFRIVLGPVDYRTFQRLAPDGPAMAGIVEVVRFYMDCGLDFEVQVILDRREIPECQLNGAQPPRLGWNAWLRELPALEDADQALFDPGS